jgi:coenzyme Q-binding protein COQ10
VEGGTEVDFFVDFEFRSRLLQMVIGTVFNEAVRLMVRAFERRAMALYGRSPPAATTAPAPQA